jgi:excisionase family DNA binding protein
VASNDQGVPGAGRRFFTIPGAADYTTLSPRAIRRLVAEGRLPAYHPTPRRTVLDRADLDRVVLESRGRHE